MSVLRRIETQKITSLREKLTREGADRLYDEELLSLIIRTGDDVKDVSVLSANLLRRYGSLRRMSELPAEQLIRENKGMSYTKAILLKAAFEIGQRASRPNKSETVIRCPEDLVEFMSPEMISFDREHFCAVLLNTKNHIISVETVSIGTVNASLVHSREVFKQAITKSAYRIILVHNHPSFDPTPSPNDITITKELVRAGKIVGINITDHIIIGGEDYYSFREHGLLREA